MVRVDIVLPRKVYSVRIAVYLFFLLDFAIVTVMAASAAPPPGYLGELTAKAEQQRLSEERYWDILLHYKPVAGGKLSKIDDSRFFLAPDGKESPQHELAATLAGFMRENPLTDEHPRCRYPARYEWLKERLEFDESRMPAVVCSKLDEALANVNPTSAELVFPAAYINSPASMFGHTILKIDSSYKSDLLAFAVNYSAVTTEINGFIYAWKGIFGLYQGYYSILPYYEKVKEYNDLEHRDMWEYRLNLAPPEVRRLALHVWELQGIASDYYFFDENCSYNLLFLLEAARPSAQLTDQSRPWVIPTDTLRAVQQNGLVASRKYRPSQGTKIRHLAAQLRLEEQRLAMQIAWQGIAATDVMAMQITNDERIKVLDLATELLQYRYGRRELAKEDFSRLFLAILKLRSGLGSPSVDLYAIEPPTAPEEGHRTFKTALSGGFRSNSPFLEVAGRLAYHGLADPDNGYIEGAQIKLGEATLRYYTAADQLQLQSFRLVDIVSLSPRDLIFHPYSWKIAVGGDQEFHGDGAEHLLYRFNSGGGFTVGSEKSGLAYLLAEIDLTAGDRLQDKYAAGAGASAGIISTFADRWKLHLALQALYYPLGERHAAYKANLTQNVRISRNNSLAMSLSGERSYNRYQTEISWGWNFFF